MGPLPFSTVFPTSSLRSRARMTTRRKKKPRTFTPGHRHGLDHAAEHFLRECYRLKKPARAKDFARSLNLTPEYTSWLGSQVLGGLLGFLRRKQVAHAAKLLRRTPLSVEEIAARSAFGSRSAMHRWFVHVYGMAPAAFRSLGDEKTVARNSWMLEDSARQ